MKMSLIFFQMASSKGFLCLFITNDSFTRQKFRDGAKKQAQDLEAYLKAHFVCDIIMKENLSALEMQTVVDKCTNELS
jgi:hypothetical protein